MTQAKKVTGLKSIPIMGDFNFHLGTGHSNLYPEEVSKFGAGHEARLNAKYVMDLCICYGLMAIQTWRQHQCWARGKSKCYTCDGPVHLLWFNGNPNMAPASMLGTRQV